MTASRERNYHRKPHTASFLQTFHTGMTQAQRREAVDQAATKLVDEDFPSKEQVDDYQAALAFVNNAPAPRNDGSYECEIGGHKVRCGGPNVTEKQAKWIIDIATTRVLPIGATADSVLIRLEQGFAKHAGSQFITTYKDLPRKAQEAAKLEAIAPMADSVEELRRVASDDVPAGRYALRGADNVVKFYRLDKPTQGKWAGWTFLKVQASDELYPIRNPNEKARIIAEIAKDVLGAEQLYGQELGKCSRCGRTLTDETSRDYGIGPDCRAKR